MSVLRVLRRTASFLAPLRETRCASCGAPVPAPPGGTGLPLCPDCAPLLARRTGGYCPRCGELAASADAPLAPCGQCLMAPRPWERFFFHAAYEGLLRDLILRFKSGHELALARLLGSFLAGRADISGPYDALVPVPLHSRRLRERGFNQALELAKPLAAKLGVPLAPLSLARTARTHPQAGLSMAERRANVRGLFKAEGVAGFRILLVDDIATTGATLESAAKELLRAGASGVDVAVVARTPGPAAGK